MAAAAQASPVVWLDFADPGDRERFSIHLVSQLCEGPPVEISGASLQHVQGEVPEVATSTTREVVCGPSENAHKHVYDNVVQVDVPLIRRTPMLRPMPDEAVRSVSGTAPTPELRTRRRWINFIVVKFSCLDVVGYHTFSRDVPLELPAGATDEQREEATYLWQFTCRGCNAQHRCRVQWRWPPPQ